MRLDQVQFLRENLILGQIKVKRDCNGGLYFGQKWFTSFPCRIGLPVPFPCALDSRSNSDSKPLLPNSSSTSFLKVANWLAVRASSP